MVQYQKALFELDLIQGTTLRNRGVEVSKPELETRTQMLLASGKFSGPYFSELKKEAQADYEIVKDLTPSKAEKFGADGDSSTGADELTPSEQDRALKALREALQP